MTVVVGVDGAGRKLVENTTRSAPSSSSSPAGAARPCCQARSAGTCCAGRPARSLSFRKVEVTCSKGGR
jgi:hypothetical protein